MKDVQGFLKDTVSYCLTPLLEGGELRNSTVMAYGESNSGKSYTLFGDNWDEQISILGKMLKLRLKGK